jgi:hypothetical protein
MENEIQVSVPHIENEFPIKKFLHPCVKIVSIVDTKIKYLISLNLFRLT